MKKTQALKTGDWVKHKTQGYIGVYEGETRIPKLFELSTDTYGCRVRTDADKNSKPAIASPSNLINLSDLSTEEKHKINLAHFGKEWKGVRTISQQHRTTHCWFCKDSLDNTTDLECKACGWILCPCGACGCGFQ